MIKRDIESFLLSKQGYLKKSPIKVAQAIWKTSSKHTKHLTTAQLTKELEQIRDVQRDMRLAKDIKETTEDSFLIDTYNKILDKKNTRRRLFFDIEVSPNIVFSWRIGRDIALAPENIISERAIICIAYKWEGDKETSCIRWNKGCDKELLKKFAAIIDTADEVVTQNGDQFDIKWLRARCLIHGVPVSPKFNSIDTLKMARAGFKFNSNKLDYMGQIMGVGQKIKTEYDLWKDIVLSNNKAAMDKMVAYCKEDVNLLEKVYKTLQEYSPAKKFRYKI